MIRGIFFSFFLCYGLLSFAQVKTFQGYKLIHPAWKINDIKTITGKMESIVYAEGDTFNIEVNFQETILVKEIDENQNFLLHCESDYFDFGSLQNLIPEVHEMIQGGIKDLDMPLSKLLVDKWGYPSQILNLDEHKEAFREMFIKMALSNDTLPDSLFMSEQKSFEEELESRAFENKILQSIAFLVMPYDNVIPLETRIDTSYVILPPFKRAVMVTSQKTAVESDDEIKMTNIINYIPNAEELLNIPNIPKNFHSQEEQVFVVDKNSTWWNEITIKSTTTDENGFDARVNVTYTLE